MTVKPTYALHAYFRHGEPTFSIINDMGIPQAREFYDYHRMFNGRTAVVFVFFSDYDLTDEQLKTIATRFMKGEYILIEIDLFEQTSIQKRGLDRTNPRQ